MQLAKVLGTVVATVKHDSLVGVRLLLIQPQDENGTPDGEPRTIRATSGSRRRCT